MFLSLPAAQRYVISLKPMFVSACNLASKILTDFFDLIEIGLIALFVKNPFSRISHLCNFLFTRFF